MKKKVLFLTFFVFSVLVFSQQKEIEFKTDTQGKKITFICINNSKTKQEVTLNFPKIKGLKGYKKPIKKIVLPNSQLSFITLTSKEKYSYNISYNYKPFFSKKEQLVLAKKQNKLTVEKLKKGIIVFSKKGCSRCKITNHYLITNNINYTYLNITDNENYNRLMWSALKENNFKGNNVLMPVILVNGKLFTNFKNLQGFLSTLKNK